MTFTHFVYVDEAGDEGFGKLRLPDQGGQSRWLLLGAVIVRGNDDPQLPALRDRILARFPNTRRKDLHFRHLHHEQKVVIAQEISQMPVGGCVMFSHKITLPGTVFGVRCKKPGFLYNYLTRWLLERVTAYCLTDARASRNLPCKVKVIFSRRRGTNYQSMLDYMYLMRDGREVIQPVRSIDWSVFNPVDIAVENHSVRAGLQFADAFTSAFFNAVEPNQYGNHETRYAEILRESMICLRGGALNAGVTPVPSLHGSACSLEQTTFFRSFIG